MRYARAQDFKRRVNRRKYSSRLSQLRWQNSPCLGSGSISFCGTPSFVCGGNGVGKSSIIRAIEIVLDEELESLPEKEKSKFSGGEYSCDVLMGDDVITINASVSDGIISRDEWEGSINLVVLNPGVQCNSMLRLLESKENVQEILDAIEPSISAAAVRSEISYMVGKDYDSHLVYEIEEYEITIPFFTVCHQQINYSFSEMGLGELVINFLHWQLQQIVEGSIVLIEEPETFVSPRSQRCLMDVVRKFATEGGFSPIITTHSMGILDDTSLEQISLVRGSSGQPRSLGEISSPSRDRLNDVLGIRQVRSTLVLVEDYVAKMFLTSMMDVVDPELLQSIEIHVLSNVDTVIRVAKDFPSDSGVNMIGLVDAGFKLDPDDNHPSIFTFPGDSPPETELKSKLEGSEQLFSELVSRPLTEVEQVLASLAGDDPHDWFIKLADRLSKSREDVMTALVHTFLSDEDSKISTVDFLQAVREATS